jgi:hypothetical protein
MTFWSWFMAYVTSLWWGIHRKDLDTVCESSRKGFHSAACQANYTDWATATCRRNLVPTFAGRGVSRVQRGGSSTVVNLNFPDRSRYFSLKHLIYPHEAEWTPFQIYCYAKDLVAPGIELWPLDHTGGPSSLMCSNIHPNTLLTYTPQSYLFAACVGY